MVGFYVTPIAQAAARTTASEPPLPSLTTPPLTFPQYEPPKADPATDSKASEDPIKEPKADPQPAPDQTKQQPQQQPPPAQQPQQQATRQPVAQQPAPIEQDNYVVHQQPKQEDSSQSDGGPAPKTDESSPMAPASTNANIQGHRQQAPDPLAGATPTPAVQPSEDLKLLEQAAAATPTPTPVPIATPAPTVAAVVDQTPTAGAASVKEEPPAPADDTKAATSKAKSAESGDSSGATAKSDDGSAGDAAASAPALAASGDGSDAGAAASAPAAATPASAAPADPAPADPAPAAAAPAAPVPTAAAPADPTPAPLVKAPEPAPAKISAPAPATISAPAPAVIAAPAPVYVAPVPVVVYAPPPPPPVIVIPPVAPELMVVGANTIESAVTKVIPDVEIATGTIDVAPLDASLALPTLDTAAAAAQDAPVATPGVPVTSLLSGQPETIAPASSPQIVAPKGAAAAAPAMIATSDPPVIEAPPTGKAYNAAEARGPPTADDFNRLLSGFGTVLTVLQTLKSYASLASNLPVIGDSVGDITHFIDSLQQSYDALSAYLASHPEPRMDEIANLLLGQVANKSVTPVVDEHQIALAISQSATHSESMPLTLGTQGTNLGVSLNANATVTGSLGIDFTIGVNLDAGVPDADRFFVKFTKLQLGGAIAADDINATATLGPLDTAVSAGAIALSATATISVNNSADGVLTVAELQAATPAGLFGTPTLAGSLSANLPLNIALNGVPLNGGALKLDSSDLFGGELTISFAGLTYQRDIVDVDTNGDDAPDLDDVTATTIGLTLTQPVAFNGFTLQSGTAVVAMIAATATATSPVSCTTSPAAWT